LHGDEGELVFREARGRLVGFGFVALVAEVEPDELMRSDVSKVFQR